MHRLERTHVLLFSLSLLTVACAPADSEAGEGGACGQGQLLVDDTCVTPSSAWTQISPGGETGCAHGAPYSFFVHPGTEDKLLVYHAFGGFCFSAELCRDGATNFVPEIEVTAKSLANSHGMLDLSRDDNPFKDWSIVYVPECTADFQWGSKTTEYPGDGTNPAVTIDHNGFVNVTAVREWMYDNYLAPERIVVSGSSGGGDAALMHYPYMREHYGDDVESWVWLVDASFGITTEKFQTEYVLNWGAYDNQPTWIPATAEAAPAELTWDFNILALADFYPKTLMAEFGSAHDLLQGFTYALHGGDRSMWNDKLEEHIANVSSQADNFRYFITAGTEHIAFDQATFYQHHVDGYPLRDWVADLADGKDVDNRKCTQDCKVTRLMEEL